MTKDDSNKTKSSSLKNGWIYTVFTLTLVFGIPRILNFYKTQDVAERLTSSICKYKNNGYSNEESIRLGTTPFIEELNNTKVKSTSKDAFNKSMEDRLKLCGITMK